MSEKIHLPRTGLRITQRCNLRCRLCFAFIPYHKDPVHTSYEEAARILDKLFKVVDTVGIITVTGGEPLLNKDTTRIMEEVYSYGDAITGGIDFVSNGTMLFPDELLDFFARTAPKTRAIISDYGELSPKASQLRETFDQRGISHKIIHYHGIDLYCDGWIDFRDNSRKHFTKEEQDKQGEACIHKEGLYFSINDGVMLNCSRSYWRVHEGIIPKVQGEYVDLLDDTISVQENRKNVQTLMSLKSTTSCSYCHGLNNDLERHYPAEQLEPGEI